MRFPRTPKREKRQCALVAGHAQTKPMLHLQKAPNQTGDFLNCTSVGGVAGDVLKVGPNGNITIANGQTAGGGLVLNPTSLVFGDGGSVGCITMSSPQYAGLAITMTSYGHSMSIDAPNGIILTHSTAIFLTGPVKCSKTITSTGSAPSIAAGAGAGTSPTVAMGSHSSDLAGTISVTTGTGATASGIVVTVTYNAGAFANGSTVIIAPKNAAAAALSGTLQVFAAGTTTTFVITAGSAALADSTVYLWNYVVIGN